MTLSMVLVHNEKEYKEVKEKLDNTGYVLTDSYGDVWEYTKGNIVINVCQYDLAQEINND